MQQVGKRCDQPSPTPTCCVTSGCSTTAPPQVDRSADRRARSPGPSGCRGSTPPVRRSTSSTYTAKYDAQGRQTEHDRRAEPDDAHGPTTRSTGRSPRSPTRPRTGSRPSPRSSRRSGSQTGDDDGRRPARDRQLDGVGRVTKTWSRGTRRPDRPTWRWRTRRATTGRSSGRHQAPGQDRVSTTSATSCTTVWAAPADARAVAERRLAGDRHTGTTRAVSRSRSTVRTYPDPGRERAQGRRRGHPAEADRERSTTRPSGRSSSCSSRWARPSGRSTTSRDRRAEHRSAGRADADHPDHGRRGPADRTAPVPGQLPDGAYDSTKYTYWPTGTLKSTTDPAGNVWSYKYDVQGRKIEENDPDKGISKFEYDATDQLSSTEDARGQKLFFSYDVSRPEDRDPQEHRTGPLQTYWEYDTRRCQAGRRRRRTYLPKDGQDRGVQVRRSPGTTRPGSPPVRR